VTFPTKQKQKIRNKFDQRTPSPYLRSVELNPRCASPFLPEFCSPSRRCHASPAAASSSCDQLQLLPPQQQLAASSSCCRPSSSCGSLLAAAGSSSLLPAAAAAAPAAAAAACCQQQLRRQRSRPKLTGRSGCAAHAGAAPPGRRGDREWGKGTIQLEERRICN